MPSHVFPGIAGRHRGRPLQAVAVGLLAGIAGRHRGRPLQAVAVGLLALLPAPLEGAEAGGAAAVKFELDIQPILTVAGCNTGACHGKSRGQNGFALSLLAYDDDFDYAAIVKEARGRRVFPAAPEESLVLRKAAGHLPHGGGVRLPAGGEHYETLRRWIAEGMPRRGDGDAHLVKIALDTSQESMKSGQQQALRVTAHYSDGSTRDVTRLTAYDTSESAIAAVGADGVVRAGRLTGEATIMARYMGHIATFQAVIPLEAARAAEEYAALARHNFIDALVWQKLAALGVLPSEPAGDSTFIRRAYLDVIGRLPRPDETRRFLGDTSLDKRTRLIDELLERPEYADHWANKWADLLRPNPYRVGMKATLSLDAWLRDAFRRNLAYDEFVRQLLTAKGSTWRNGATVLFRDRRSPDEVTTMVSQLFLGIRLECAKCHHHPFEVWGQDDFYGLAAFFARVGRKGTGISPPISGSEEMVFTGAGAGTVVTHPATGQAVAPRPLFGELPEQGAEGDPREALAAWIASDENPYFAQVAVNRVWAELMGVGLVDPVDDLRATNPPSNPALLEALADDFRRHGYDHKHLIRTIATSYVYGLSSLAGPSSAADSRNYSRHYRQRLRAEVLLDAVCDVSGVGESFAAMPPGSRAVELWTHRIESLFLDSFGRPDPNQDPPCERTGDTTVVQALHLMNAPSLHRKVTDSSGRAARLAASAMTNEQIIEELYLLAYSRLPDEQERAELLELFAQTGTDRRGLVEDILWALLNTPEFVFKN